MARLGSGSAARSIDGGLVLWGSHPGLPGSSDLYAIPYPGEVHPVFTGFHDTILLVDKGALTSVVFIENGKQAGTATIGH